MKKELLEKIIDDANVAYHTFGFSELSDDQYDNYIELLRKVDPKNKRLKKVGAEPDKAWEKYDHGDWKMGSQSKVTDKESFQKWCSKNPGPYIVQEKLDGFSLKLEYNNGDLVVAGTRGDGSKGENVTRNVLLMKGVPKKIGDKRHLVIRGEVLLYKSLLDTIGGKNPRNACTGTAKRLDGKGCEHLQVKVYDIMNWNELEFTESQKVLDHLKFLGFETVSSVLVANLDSVQGVMEQYIKTTRDSLDWDIDGLVVKCNSLEEDEWEHPKRQVAYKFPSVSKFTTLVDVIWNDKGGRISPVGILEPVDIGGVTVSKATLNNMDYINDLHIHIGDTVEVSRRNDVIPCIEKVVSPGSSRKKIVPPSHDSEGFTIVKETNSEGKELAYYVSTNPNSFSRRSRRILSWFRVHEVKGIASATIESVMEAGIATDLPAFYDMCKNGDDRLLTLEGFGNSTFKLLKKASLQTSETTIENWLDGCDIQGFSSRSYVKLFDAVDGDLTPEDALKLLKNVEFVKNIPGFGENSAKDLAKEVSKEEPILLEMLKRVKVKTRTKEKTVAKSISLLGKSFCFTGKMDNERTDLEKLVKENGGLVAGVSKKLDFLVTNDTNSGSSKNKKADDLGIPKITEKVFLNMIRGGTENA